VYAITQSSTGGSDALAAAAAALASATVAMNSSRPALAAQALTHAKQLYDWASSAALYNTSYCSTVVPCTGAAVPLAGLWTASQAAGGDAGTGPAEVPWAAYPSSSVLDDLAWAGIWLYQATGGPAGSSSLCAVLHGGCYIAVYILRDGPACVSTHTTIYNPHIQQAVHGVSLRHTVPCHAVP
jgi:hypothetical protein